MPCTGSWLKSRPAVPKARSRSAITTLVFRARAIAQAVLWQTVLEPDAALGADEGDDLADRIGLRVGVDVRDALDDLHHLDRRDDIFAHAAAQQLAVEHDVVDMADDDHLGAGIAAFGKPVELAQHVAAVEQRSR